MNTESGIQNTNEARLPVASAPFKREYIEWLDLWSEDSANPEAKRVVMLGDSISKQYRSGVAQRLKDKFAIVNSAGSRCVGDPALAAETRYVLSLYDYDVIHFNNGLHGFSMADECFEGNLRDWIKLIRELQPKAKLIWATITSPLDKTTPRVDIRNAAAMKVIAEFGDIAVDDLGLLSRQHPELIRDDKVHFTPEGCEVLAEAVAASIMASDNHRFE